MAQHTPRFSASRHRRVLESILYYVSRPAKYPIDQILDRSRDVVLASGPAGLTVAAVADLLGAPSGSIYYRFSGRDVLAASLWLRAVRRFQAGFVSELDNPDPLEAAVAAARHVVRWSGQHLDDARLLLLFRSGDLVRDGWPTDLQEENLRLQRQLEQGVKRLQSSLGAHNRDSRHRVRFAVIDVPYAAVRPSLIMGRRPANSVEGLVAETVGQVLKPLIHHSREEAPWIR